MAVLLPSAYSPPVSVLLSSSAMSFDGQSSVLSCGRVAYLPRRLGNYWGLGTRGARFLPVAQKLSASGQLKSISDFPPSPPKQNRRESAQRVHYYYHQDNGASSREKRRFVSRFDYTLHVFGKGCSEKKYPPGGFPALLNLIFTRLAELRSEKKNPLWESFETRKGHF